MTGETATPPAEMVSQKRPRRPVAANGSLPETSRAPPLSVQPFVRGCRPGRADHGAARGVLARLERA